MKIVSLKGDLGLSSPYRIISPRRHLFVNPRELFWQTKLLLFFSISLCFIWNQNSLTFDLATKVSLFNYTGNQLLGNLFKQIYAKNSTEIENFFLKMNCLRQEKWNCKKMNVALSAVEHQLKKTFAVEKLVHENLPFFRTHENLSENAHSCRFCVDFPFVWIWAFMTSF